MADNVTYLIPPGKIPCFITGKHRPDTPEENVRQRWARSLVEEYGYPKTDLGIEVTVPMGRARKRVDLAVYQHDVPHKTESVLIFIETKRGDKKLSKDDEDQFKSYMAAAASCRFGMLVGDERRAYEKIEGGGIERVPDVPRFGADSPKPPTRNDLVRTHELKSVFKRCHNYVYANAGLQKGEAFQELLKLIFCKTFDEEESGDELQFSVDPQERRSTGGQRRLMEERIMPLFRRVRERYPFIFDDDDQIKLEERVVAYIVSELQFLSLLDTETDVKGDAYEELVGANLRGDRGEYFTPRNVCDMAVRMAMGLYDPMELTSLKVLDCCCGTGGFLVSWLTNLLAVLLDQEESRPSRRGLSPEQRARKRIQDVCTRNLYGLDINPTLVRTCQMNLVLHGDGSSNIYRVDSVRSPGEWSAETRRAIPYGKADLLFTNPPFGGKAKIDDAHILSRYELPSWETSSPHAAMPAEQLFIETALGFLKPGGYLVIVLPDGIVNNPGLRYIRHWLLRRSRIVASVGLPKTTFSASKGINNPTVLIVQKFTATEAKNADAGLLKATYNVFMSIPRTAGINSRTKPIYLRQPDGREIVDDRGERIRDDEIRGVADAFVNWLRVESSI